MSKMTCTRGSFVPGNGSIHLRFVNGIDGLAPVPELVVTAGCNYRFAVVQDTFVKGCGDMYFDEQLWRTLLDFVGKFGTHLKVIGIGPGNDFDEMSITRFLENWAGVDPEEKSPPWSVLALQDGRLTIAMVTENWAAVGGQQPYSDSYTYSIYSNRELSGDILQHLQTSHASERWSFDFPIIDIPASKIRMPPIAPGRFTRLLSKWRGVEKRRS